MPYQEARDFSHGRFTQVIIKVPRPCLLELIIEDSVPVFEGIKESTVKLGGKRETVTGMTVHENFFCDPLAGRPAVHNSCIEIGEPCVDKGIHHLFDFLDIHTGSVILVEHSQPHKSKTESVHCSLLSRGVSSLFILYPYSIQ